MSGFETIEAMRKEHLAEGSKIIIISNQGQESDIEKAKKLSTDGCITKASAIPSEVFAETIHIIEGGSEKSD
jgi:DNA-binding NarL/FixJ family response regulator